MMRYTVISGDIETADIPGVFDAVLCDPPYGLSFMGKSWDHGVPGAPIWQRVYDHLRPGAHVVAFGGTRTHHRLMVAIEDAGFEIRDCLMWLYGSGFPKSRDISKAIDAEAGAEREAVGRGKKNGGASNGRNSPSVGYVCTTNEYDITAPATDAARTWAGYGTALKPAWEPAILAMRPTVGTFAANALQEGVAGLNVDGGRVGTTVESWPASRRQYPSAGIQPGGNGSGYKTQTNPAPAGRWPANVILDPDAAAMLGAQSGERASGHMDAGTPRANRNGYAGPMPTTTGAATFGDTGTAARFFYTAKASRRERNAGLEGGNHHPTVKPIDLCQYLATLLLPPDTGRPRRLLVPFSGSGSEMIGALLAGWDEVVGVELSPEYADIARARLDWWTTIARQLPGPLTAARVLEYAGLGDDAEAAADDVIDFGLFAAKGDR